MRQKGEPTMTERLKQFVNEILEKAEKEGLSIKETHCIPYALQMEFEKKQWIDAPFKRTKPQE